MTTLAERRARLRASQAAALKARVAHHMDLAQSHPHSEMRTFHLTKARLAMHALREAATRQRQRYIEKGAAKFTDEGAATVKALADSRQVQVTITTDAEDRDGDIVSPAGLDTTAFMRTRTVLFAHDAKRPIARCLSLTRTRNGITALTQFPPAGISPLADEIYGLIRAGVINSASIGFRPLEFKARQSSLGGNGLHITKSELFEFSFVSVPSNRGALITAREATHA